MALFTGIGATFKAMRSKANGNGHGHASRKDLEELKETVGEQGYALRVTQLQVSNIQTTLDRHDTKLDGIRDDIAEIMAAVRRND